MHALNSYQLKVVFDLKARSFIHAVLMIDDLLYDYLWVYMTDNGKLSLLQNFEIYVGNDSETATNNTRCPGGPFLDIDDESNYFTDNTNGNTIPVWKWGAEIWCNLEG